MTQCGGRGSSELFLNRFGEANESDYDKGDNEENQAETEPIQKRDHGAICSAKLRWFSRRSAISVPTANYKTKTPDEQDCRPVPRAWT
jgi:hypothetical protein